MPAKSNGKSKPLANGSQDSAEQDAEPTTVYGMLKPFLVPFKTLRKRHLSLLLAVRKIIGITPNCDKFLEIWPPAFTTYNAIIPTFLDLPGSFLRWSSAAPIDMLGVALYYSSMQSGCGYCTLHCCYFALARGVPRANIRAPHDIEGLPETERLVARVAVGLAAVPARLAPADREALRAAFSPHAAEHVVLATCMMGYLNKMMDCTGIDMEAVPVEEVGELLRSTGSWSVGKFGVAPPDTKLQKAAKSGFKPDSLGHKLSMVPLFPALAFHEVWVQWRTPGKWPEAGAWLQERVGHSFPVLAHLRSDRARKAIATVLDINLNPRRKESTLAAPLKHLAGVVFAARVQNSPLAAVFCELAMAGGVPAEAVAALLKAAEREMEDPVQAAMANPDRLYGDTAAAQTPASGDASDHGCGSEEEGASRLVLALAHFCAQSPADLSKQLVKVIGARLNAKQAVEVFNWMSVLGMLQRLYAFYIPEACPA